MLGCLITGCIAGPIVYADQYTQQIQQLQTQNSQAQSSLNTLQLQATSYQDAVNQLQEQIYAIQESISASQNKQVELQQQIQQAQTQIANEKQVLGDDIRAMYISGQMNTIEELATSKSLSDFVDAQTYRNAVQTRIQETLTQITQLENQLKSQQVQVASLLQTQRAQQTQLYNDQQQQTQLLSYNQQQQNQYNQQIQTNSSQISQLQAEQAAINNQYAQNVIVAPSPGGGACNIGQGFADYPWCNASFTFDYSQADPNGFPERQCTSFAYWYFTSAEGNSLSVSGNAGQWWYTANQPVDQTPAVGAIGVEASNEPPHYSPYGHVMIVLALPGTTYNGALPYTSQADGVEVPSGDVLVMSMNEDENGHFMIQDWPADTLYYIH